MQVKNFENYKKDYFKLEKYFEKYIFNYKF